MTNDDVENDAPEQTDLLAEVGLGKPNPPENEGPASTDDVDVDDDLVVLDAPVTDAEVDELVGVVSWLTGMFWELSCARLGIDDKAVVSKLTQITDTEEIALKLTARGAVPHARRIMSGTGGPWPFVGAVALMSVSRAMTLRTYAESQHVPARPPQDDETEDPAPPQGRPLDPGTAAEHRGQ